MLYTADVIVIDSVALLISGIMHLLASVHLGVHLSVRVFVCALQQLLQLNRLTYHTKVSVCVSVGAYTYDRLAFIIHNIVNPMIYCRGGICSSKSL